MRFIKRLFFLALLGALTGAGLLYWFANTPLSLRSSPLDFTIESGMSLRRAATVMQDAGLGFEDWQFHVFARALQKSAAIKAGSYEVEQGITPWLLLQKLTRGDVSQGEILFVEGRTFREYRAAIDAHPDFRHDTRGLSDSEIMSAIGAQESYPEGLFLPDTYLFDKQGSDLALLRRAYQAMQKRLARAWESRDSSLPYKTPYEALIMASIVEKETGKAGDRPMVASVFVNRLKSGMLLQTDPTVIYGMGERYAGNIRKADLTTDTPYNTYVHAGLPPTPIAMPGLAALQVTLNPPASDKYYFVARGDGSSEFSRTLEEHNRAVARYQLKRGK